MAGDGVKSEYVIRVNGVESGLMSADLRAVFEAGPREPDALMIPKCESIEHLQQVCVRVCCVRVLCVCVCVCVQDLTRIHVIAWSHGRFWVECFVVYNFNQIGQNYITT